MVPLLTVLLHITPESERDKIRRIYDRYHDDLLRYAKNNLRNAHRPNYDIDAQDIVQEAFLRIVKNIKSIRTEEQEEQTKSYVFVTVNNLIMSLLSRQKNWISLEDCEDVASFDDDFIERLGAQEDCERIKEGVRRLPDKYKVVFICRYDKEMSVEKIAEELQISAKAVYNRLSRGRQMLLAMLDGRCNTL